MSDPNRVEPQTALSTEVATRRNIVEAVNNIPNVFHDWEDCVQQRLDRNEHLSREKREFLELSLHHNQLNLMDGLEHALKFRLMKASFFSGMWQEPTADSLVNIGAEAIFLPESAAIRRLQEFKEPTAERFDDEFDEYIYNFLMECNQKLPLGVDLIEVACRSALGVLDKRTRPETAIDIFKVTSNLQSFYKSGSPRGGYELNDQATKLFEQLRVFKEKRPIKDGGPAEYFPHSIAAALQYVNRKALAHYVAVLFPQLLMEEEEMQLEPKYPNILENAIHNVYEQSELATNPEFVKDYDEEWLTLGIQSCLIEIGQQRENFLMDYSQEHFSASELSRLFQFPGLNRLLDV